MSDLTKLDLWNLTKTIFDHSTQALLIAEKANITYCNDAAIDMLQLNPIDRPLIDFVDYRFAASFLTPEENTEQPKRTRARFGEGYYEILVVPYDSFLFLFFYYPNVVHTAKELLRDTAHTLLALTATARADSKQVHFGDHLNQIDLAVEEALAACEPVLFPYDFSSLLSHALLSFACIRERGMLTFEVLSLHEKLFVPMHAKLLHAALVGIMFDLLRLTDLRDPLEITMEHKSSEVKLSFSCKQTQFPTELHTLLFAQDASDPVGIMQKYGTHLFRARRIFSLHNSALQIQTGRKTGFILSATLPLTAHPPILYAGSTQPLDFPSYLSLPESFIRSFFGLDSEKA